MKAKGSLLFITLLTALLLLSTSTFPAGAHTVPAIDGNPSDWANLGNGDCPAAPENWTWAIIPVNHADCGLSTAGWEWVWSDPSGDENTNFRNPDRAVDIVQFRVTGDTDYIYFFIRMVDIPPSGTGNGAPMVQIAIDEELIEDSGGTLGFLHNAETAVSRRARWERLIVTTFGSSSEQPVVYDGSTPPTVTVIPDLGSDQAISHENDLIEIKVPWTMLNASSDDILRFTVTTYHSASNDIAWNVPDWPNALDAITDFQGNTLDEVKYDKAVDYSFDITFDSPTAVELREVRAGVRDDRSLPLALALGALVVAGFLARMRLNGGSVE